MKGNNNNIPTYITFNQDSSCFAIATTNGFCIFNTFPYEYKVQRTFDFGIIIIEMLNKCNIIALVGDGKNERFGQNKLILWEDSGKKIIAEIILKFSIKTVKLKRTKIFIGGEKEIYVFNFGSFNNIDKIETYPNKNGIFTTCLNTQINLIGYLSREIGKIVVKNYDEIEGNSFKTSIIHAHQSEVTALAMNIDGTLLASAGEKGSVLKIFRVENGNLIQELRRGSDSAGIYSLAFGFNSKYLACSSSRETVHIFALKNESNVDIREKKNVLKSVGSLFGASHINKERSIAQLRIFKNEKVIVSFCPDDSPGIIILSYNGKYYHASFDPKNGGECDKILEREIFQNDSIRSD